jgi:hypothetical protein
MQSQYDRDRPEQERAIVMGRAGLPLTSAQVELILLQAERKIEIEAASNG